MSSSCCLLQPIANIKNTGNHKIIQLKRAKLVFLQIRRQNQKMKYSPSFLNKIINREKFNFSLKYRHDEEK